ncbi:hypothetical protein Droror1_Dr00016373, partial [Drosera rotundifolia]
YDKVLVARRAVEEEEDFVTMDSKPTLIDYHLIEEQAGKCYTRKMFTVFSKEWKLSGFCGHERISKDDNVIRYRVGLLKLDKSFWRIVDYAATGEPRCKCSCGKFEN